MKWPILRFKNKTKNNLKSNLKSSNLKKKIQFLCKRCQMLKWLGFPEKSIVDVFRLVRLKSVVHNARIHEFDSLSQTFQLFLSKHWLLILKFSNLKIFCLISKCWRTSVKLNSDSFFLNSFSQHLNVLRQNSDLISPKFDFLLEISNQYLKNTDLLSQKLDLISLFFFFFSSKCWLITSKFWPIWKLWILPKKSDYFS